MSKLTLPLASLLLLSLVIGTVGCATAPPTPTPIPTPTPVPTPTPISEQKRSDVLKYLRAFNTIDNNLYETLSALQAPETLQTESEKAALNSYLEQVISSIDGAIARMEGLSAPVFDPQFADHLETATAYFNAQRQTAEALSATYTLRDEASIVALNTSYEALVAQTITLRQATEQLLLNYNIGDQEAEYHSRGG